MKTQKLIVIAAIVCLLVGASGAAMARNDCGPFNRIDGGAFTEIVINEPFANCTITNVTVSQRLRVNLGGRIEVYNSRIAGVLRITDSQSVSFYQNEVFNADASLNGNELITVIDNRIEDGDLRVNGGGGGVVESNRITDGDLRVNRNQGSVTVSKNFANGDITCLNNTLLDAFANAATGNVNCAP
jgi:hypothetical protein